MTEEKQVIVERAAAFLRSDREVPGPWMAKRELAAALRELLDSMCATNADEHELRFSAGKIREMSLRFAAQPRMKEREGIAEMALTGMETFHDRSPLVGRSNPIAPPMELTPDPETGIVSGTVTFGTAYEGAPGCVHGGFVAAAFDEALGMVCIFTGNPGMTGELFTRYENPTPTEAELRVEARIDRVEGRKIYTSGEIVAGDLVTARATGLFISITYGKFAALERELRLREQAGSTKLENKT